MVRVQRFAVVGPGRLGSALARRWIESGLEPVGFVAREPGGARAALDFCGAGVELDGWAALTDVPLVVVTVSDRALPDVAVRAAAAGAVGAGAVWVHTSGVFDLEVLAPVRRAGGRTGSLHPLVPVPDAATGHATFDGKPAVVQADPGVWEVVEDLARRAGLEPARMAAGDRALYHAACALAANGATALLDAVRELFAAAGIDTRGADRLGLALVEGALAACSRLGPVAALSGPVRRGDVAVVRSHLEALADEGSEALAIYRGLMRRALDMARRAGGLDPSAQRALEELLGEGDA